MPKLSDVKIAVIGLGYVGLPLAVAFSKKFQVLGFDINSKRIKELKSGVDSTQEVSKSELDAVKIYLFRLEEDLNPLIFIVTVPTPIDKYKNQIYLLC